MFLTNVEKDENGVPILTKERLDYIAECYIRDFNAAALKTPQEIDIDSFVFNYLKLKQDFQYLSHCGAYLGMLVYNDTNKLPVYDPVSKKPKYISAKADTVIIDNSLLEEKQECRYRFTVGHEAGHFIGHKDKFLQDMNIEPQFGNDKKPVVSCRASNLEGKFKPYCQWNQYDWMEWQANYISAALLMPKSMVLRMLYDKKLLKAINEEVHYDPRYCCEMFTRVVAQTFNVSMRAAAIRLKNLSLIKLQPGFCN